MTPAARGRKRGSPESDRGPPHPLRLSSEAARAIRDEVGRAGGREVSFLARVTEERVIHDARAVARGNYGAVLAVAREAEAGGVMIHNHPSGNLEPSDADLSVAARLYGEGLGTAIVTNDASRLYVVVEPPEPRRIEPLDLDELTRLLAPGGPLASMPGYEDREGQREMLRFVGSRFNEGGVGLVEAGTGTGKSVAYLVPAVEWAHRNGERTVVSTNTINLQEQLVHKDIGIAEGVVGAPVTWALVKGRGNYVSIRRARLAAETAPTLFPDDRSQEIDALLEWLERTEDGSLSDLPFTPSPEVWEEARSETDACLRAKCPHFQECFYQRSRRAAAGADIVVANHSLFFSDLAIRIATGNTRDGAVLPAYDRVVFDEAHHLEDAATPHLGTQVTRAGLFRVLARLDRGGKGILASVYEGLLGCSIPGLESVRERIEGKIRPAVEGLRSELGLLFDALEPWAEARSAGEGVRLGPTADTEPADDPRIGARLEAVLIRIQETRRAVAGLRERLEVEDELGPSLEGRLLDLGAAERRLDAAGHALRVGLLPEHAEEALVRWMEVRRSGRRGPTNVVVASAPVDLGPALREHLFDRVESAVLTSATMSANGTFEYLRGRLGLEPALDVETDGPRVPVDEALVPSPFDFERQTCLVVPTDLPDAADPAQRRAFHEASARVVYETAEASDGGLFVLFTSFGALRAVADGLRARGAEGRWGLFVQGEGDRSSLLRGFTEHGRAILLGTSSFWEGVDVPGHPLRALIIHKLPFRVPTEPITAARLEAIEARGESSFWSYMVPGAAIRLKQGVGRLIRSATDRGVVVLLDDRMLRKRYGRVLRQSLPPMPLHKGPWEEVRGRVRAFYRAADAGDPVAPGAYPSPESVQ